MQLKRSRPFGDSPCPLQAAVRLVAPLSVNEEPQPKMRLSSSCIGRVNRIFTPCSHVGVFLGVGSLFRRLGRKPSEPVFFWGTTATS